ncbi:MAG: ABC transporter ATP-binding protein [Myxococcales bacterium]|nr:ABC transporter ATP-binding protein [Myxococcales bacterium]
MTEQAPLLEVDQLKIHFRSRGRWVRAVDGVSFTVGAGEGVAVIGESGSGKTLSALATLALVGGEPGVVSGQIRYQDDTLKTNLLDGVEDSFRLEQGHYVPTRQAENWRYQYRQRARALAGLKIGIIFQNPIASQDPLWSVGRTLSESIRIHNPKASRKEAWQEGEHWLERVHIKNPAGVMRAYPHQLSGGMCQRVMIASTLAMHPRIIIADEPTTGLDMTTKAQVLYLLHEAREKFGSSLIFVTHEIGLISGLTERVVVMRRGHVVDEFPTSTLFDVKIVGDTLESPHTFADHTQDLLRCSLTLEQRRGREQALSS